MRGVGTLQLESIKFKDYRGIEELEFAFQGKSAVIYGINGAGKSSVLKGISLLLSQIITRIVSNQFKQQISISRDDVRFGSSVARIEGNFTFENGKSYPYSFSYDKSTAAKKNSRKELSEFTELFTSSYLGDADFLPVFAHYGVNRVVLDIPLRIRGKHEFGRLETYLNSINSKTDFRTFFEWFRNQEDIENAQKVESGDLSYRDTALEATRRAITTMLPELSNIRIIRKPLRMCASKNGKTLSVEQLSDGEKCTLAMLGDLARRLVLANPEVEDPLKGGGIVLIDEIELHMHPSWQRRIVAVLREIFPNIQFIIATHSPLVLGGLNDDDCKLFGLSQEDGEVMASEMPVAFYDANLVLEDNMGTPSISPVVTKVENSIFEAVAQEDFDDATAHVAELSRITRGTHPSIPRAQILIRRGRAGKGVKRGAEGKAEGKVEGGLANEKN